VVVEVVVDVVDVVEVEVEDVVDVEDVEDVVVGASTGAFTVVRPCVRTSSLAAEATMLAITATARTTRSCAARLLIG
jgi:hypothetical protein